MAMTSPNNKIVSLKKAVRCLMDTFTDDSNKDERTSKASQTTAI